MMRTSSPFTVPKAPEILYRNDLYKLVKAMIKDYRSILTIYKDKKEQVAMDAVGTWLTTDMINKLDKLGSKWKKKFQEYADYHSKRFVTKLMKMSNTQIKSVLKDWFADKRLELIGETIPTEIQQVVKAHTAYNISLVSSIPTRYHERVFGAAMRSINGGGSLKQLTTEIARYGAMEYRSAKLIALDQTRKVYSNITLHNCQRLGVQKMQWLHSHAVRDPRPLHIRKWDGKSDPRNPNGLDGLIFDIDNPPLIQEARVNSKGKTVPAIYGYPTDLVNCSCIMRAVIDS